MKKRIIIAFVVILSLCGCSNINYIYQKRADSTTTLRLCWNWSDYRIKSETFSEVIGAYISKNHSVNIENEYYRDDSFYQKLQVDFSSNNPPDIISTRFGNIIEKLINNKKLADLSELYDRSDGYLAKLIENDALTSLSADGKIYGIPLERTYVYLYINNDIFNFCSAKIPENFAELEEAIIKIKDSNIVPIAFDASSDNYLYQAIVSRINENILHNSENDSFSKEAYKEGLDYIKHLYDIGAFSANALSSSNEQQNNLFLSKNAAMIVRDSGFISTISAYNSDNSLESENSSPFTAISFPQKSEIKIGNHSIVFNSYLSCLGDATFYASADSYENTLKKEAINNFFTYITNETNINLMLQNGMVMSTVTHGTTNEILNPLATQTKLNIIDAHDICQMPGIIAPENIWNRDIIEKMIPFLQSEISSQEMTETLFSNIK